MTLQWINDKPVIVGNKLAMHPDCCCIGGRCDFCTTKIAGVEIILTGLNNPDADPPDWPDCYCAPMNGTYFIPWDWWRDQDACVSNKDFDPDVPENCGEGSNPPGSILTVTAGYNLECANDTLYLTAWVEIWDGWTQYTIVGIECTFPAVGCDIECKGLTCTKPADVWSGWCTGGTMTATIQ